eukprot:5433275-Amphidinium_carterae.1
MSEACEAKATMADWEVGGTSASKAKALTCSQSISSTSGASLGSEYVRNNYMNCDGTKRSKVWSATGLPGAAANSK